MDLTTQEPYRLSLFARFSGAPWPEAEPIIASDLLASYSYAREVLNARFPAGEPVIARDPLLALEYAREVIRGPFPLGEAKIATDSSSAFQYARYILQAPFPAGERAIARNTLFSVEYAVNVLKGPFPAGEQAIAKDPACALEYAKYALKGPFPAAEKAIAEITDYSVAYAMIIGARFLAAEDYIRADPLANSVYEKMVVTPLIAPLQTIRERILERIPSTTTMLDTSETKTGSSFLRLSLDGHPVVVEWRPSEGLSVVSSHDIAYGEGPHEVFSDAQSAIDRIADLLSNKKHTQPGTPKKDGQ